ncbi:PREDICTED: DNA polymerase eta isoform X2 [Populus euphratica]|uniref:DNA polymerase eta n=1 Tax=Populus euphratica TaxID=75702 RepID=A0AAJ6U2Z9_POPEU|nr:PREDICTED: DNA polymerase eta isoform X2 [Populus euphratica]
MPVARPEPSDSRTRIIAHVDLDCFYVQVEQRKQPELRGLPTAVVQYNEWKGGALIAVSYEARKLGVSRHMRGDDAKEVCPQIHLVQVPVARGKADLNTYRNAGSEVVSVLARKGRCERASIDEVYLDLTDSAEAMLRETPPESLESINEEARKSHILGLKSEDANDAQENVSKWLCRSDANHQDKLLACGALIVAELRMEVLKETQFTCSAGIAHNKMLAKLVSGMNKPAQQTVVPFSSVKGLLESLPIKKMKQLGGKLGTSLQTELGVNTVGDLLQFSEEKLQERFGINTGTWLWNIARGINGEEVQGRLLPKSHGAGKSFPGPRALKTIASVQHWLNQLCDELNERICCDLDQNKRIAHNFTVYASAYKSCDSESYKKFPSKSCPLRYGTAKIQEDAFNLFQAGLREYIGSHGVKTLGHHHNGWGITSLSVSASKIVPIPSVRSQNTFMDSIHHPFQRKHRIALSKKPCHYHRQAVKAIQSWNQLISCNLRIMYRLWVYKSRKEFYGKIRIHLVLQQCRQMMVLAREPPHHYPQVLYSRSGCCSLVNQTGSQGASRVDSTMPTLERHKRKIKPSDKEQGTILKFLKSYNLSCSPPMQENVEMVKGSQSPSSCSLEVNQVELPRRSLAECSTNDGSNNLDQNAQRAWNYKIDEIDQSIVNELPSEIQDEIRVWLQARQQPSIVKRPSIIKRGSIAHYFSPDRNT